MYFTQDFFRYLFSCMFVIKIGRNNGCNADAIFILSVLYHNYAAYGKKQISTTAAGRCYTNHNIQEQLYRSLCCIVFGIQGGSSHGTMVVCFCRSTGRAINATPKARFITKFISLAQVVTSPVHPYRAATWPKSPSTHLCAFKVFLMYVISSILSFQLEANDTVGMLSSEVSNPPAASKTERHSVECPTIGSVDVFVRVSTQC